MIKFRTESGSIYTLRPTSWESTSTNTRTRGGPANGYSEVIVGRPVLIIGPGLEFGSRIIETTRVVEILEEVPECAMNP